MQWTLSAFRLLALAVTIRFLAAGAWAGDFSAWNFSRRILFNTTSSGANVSGNVSNFPLLVRLTSTNFVFTQADPSGDDLRFNDPDGTTLSYQIERWDAANKLAEVWVKVPQVDGNSDRDYITMYWGNNSAAAASSGSGVFSAFAGAWHLNESPAAGANGFVDASGNANHGTAQGGATGDSLTAVAAKGYKLNGSSKYVSTATSHSAPASFTTSCWFKSTTTSGGKIFGLGNSQTGSSTSYDRHVYMANDGKLHLGLYPGSYKLISTTTAYNDGTWHHVVGRHSSTAGLFLYVDGVLVASDASMTSASGTAGYWRFGYDNVLNWSNAPTSYYFNGTLDEARVAHSDLGADHIKLSYETQKPTVTAVTHEGVDLSDWSYSTKVYVNTTASGANITSNQSNFPLLVRLSAANFNFSQAQASGADLRFADSAGNLLAYEVERFDATNKLAEIWVLLPTVYGNNNSQWFKMYWGNGTAASLSSGSSVFLSQNSYIVNWHMSGSSGSMQDATPYAHSGTGSGNVPNQVDGAIGKAQDFDGDGDFFSAGGASTMDVATNDKITLSAWVRRDGSGVTGHEEGILGKFEWTAGNYRCYALDYVNASGFKFLLSSDGTSGTETGLTTTGNTVTNGTWYHVAAVSDNATMKVYLNGTLVASQAYSSGIFGSTSADFKVGQLDDNGATRQYWNGVIDEASAAATARSADWIKLSYENQKSGSTVATVGARDRDYSKSLQLTFNTTSSGANVPGNVANIPILVRLTSSNFDFTAVRDDASDLQFIDKTGQYLYHEVVQWDKGNKTGKVWVKVPQVDGNSTADFITLHYGCSTCTGAAYAVKDSVWSGHAAVFHLSGGETRAFDATKNGYHGDYQRSQPMAAGITTALAPSFDGANDYIQTTVPTTAGTRTFSAWIYPRSSDNVTFIESVIDGDVDGQFGGGFGLDNGYFKVILDNEFWSTMVTVTLNTWQHVALRFNATKAVLYKNGSALDSVTYTQGGISSTTLRIGRSAANALYFDGLLNEVQVMDSYASADWLKLSYENQKESSLLFTSLSTASFSQSKVIKFNTTASGANVTGDVYDFPLLLRFTDATLIDATRSAGQDIRFLDADGVTWLPYQIERWDQGSNVGEIWVKVPKVDGNSAGDFITMYYDEATADQVPDGQCASCVFSTAAGFSGVWHMNDNAASTTVTETVASQNGTYRSNTTNENTSNHTATGMIGLGLDFQGGASGSGGGTQLNNFTHTLAWPKTTGSISHWVKPDQVRIMATLYESNGTTATTYNGFTVSGTDVLECGLGMYNTAWSFDYQDGTTSGIAQVTGGSPSAGSWAHVAATWDRNGTAYLYVNGSQVGSVAMSGKTWTSKTPTVMQVGRVGDGTDNRHWDGAIDEIQVSSVQRSADWMKLAYESQRASPTLFNPSPADFVSTRTYRFNTTRTGANVMGDVTSFPLLVRITGSTIVDAVQNDYDDIRFLDGDGKTWLNYVVERWDKTKDSAEVWVLVPKVDGNSDRDFITLYYNDVTDGAVVNGQCGSCVFSSSNSFVAAWNLNTSGTGARPNLVSGGNSATPANYDNDEYTGGIIAGADNLDGGSPGDHLSLGTGYADFTGGLTFTVWAYPTNTASYARFFDLGSGAPSNNIWLGRNGTTTDLSFEVFNGTTSGGYTTATGALATNAWQHFVVTMDASSNVRIYKNGTVVQTGTSTQSIANASRTSTYIGRSNWADAYYQGRIDQPQILNAAMDSNWVRLAYETQRLAGNVFWNSRPGPNNKTTLTATPGSGAISLAWTTPVSDSTNADSVGIWLKYSGALDSVGATGQTKVVLLPKTDSTYSYPATYAGTYVFGLAVRNASGQWSPFTALSIDTVQQMGSTLTDTIYVDSAIGTASGGTAASCTNARNPSTPLAELEDAVWCAQASGFTPNDTLVVRVLPGTYSGSENNVFTPPSTYPVVVTAFDGNSRPILASATHPSFTVQLGTHLTLRRMDVRAATNATAGIQVAANADSVVIDGCRIYNNGNTKLDTGIVIPGNNNEGIGVFNTLIHQPNKYGVYVYSDDRTNIIGNTFVGSGAAGTMGIYMPKDAWSTGFLTFTNNLFHNWDYGIHTTDANSEVGTVSHNLFHLVTSGREVVGETDANKIVKDPLFYSTQLGDRHAFKLLPGSPAIDAGTSTINTLAAESWPRVSYADHYGTARPQGSARDIGLYEGTGYTPNPAGEFDSLITAASGNTVTVKNSKFKLVWDKAQGGGIAGFYDMTGDTTANLLAASTPLFDFRVDTHRASAQGANATVPAFEERTRARCVVRQRIYSSASMDLNAWYTVYASGHVYIRTEIANISGSTLQNLPVNYSLKVATASSAPISGGAGSKNGFGYLLTATRDAFIAVTEDLDSGAGGVAETWLQTASTAGTTDSIGWNTTDMADLGVNGKRHHHFLVYVGDKDLTLGKASALHADAYSPSIISTSAGSRIHERSWQDQLAGHWSLDEGGGSSAQDKSFTYTNHATLTSTTWVSGQVNGALRFTTSSVGVVSDHDALEAGTSRSYMLWVKPDFSSMGGTAFILSKGLTTSSGWYFRKVSGQNQIQFVMGSASVTSPTLTSGAWAHLAAVANAQGVVTLYVNGVQVGASTTGSQPAGNASSLRLGENAGSGAADRFAGDLDDIRIYHYPVKVHEIQAIHRRSFSVAKGHYHLRADNNNRVVALLNESAAATRVQPAFQIDNWYGSKTPKYVYLNGTRLIPNVDFVSDSIVHTESPSYGNNIVLQVNKVLTGQSQTLFVDDNDSTGYLGEAGKMKSLTISATASDKVVIKNFSDTVFGNSSSGQWYLELDLNGWTTPTANRATDTGFGEFNVWKAAAINPNLSVSSAANLTGMDPESGRNLSHMKFDNTGVNEMYSAGLGYSSPANLTYTLTDSSSTRLSLTLATITLTGEGTITLKKRFTVYPTGRIFANFEVTTTDFAFDAPRIDVQGGYDARATRTWSHATAAAQARYGYMGGELSFHSFGTALLSIKSAGATTSSAAGMVSSADGWASNSGAVYSRVMLNLQTGLFEAADDPVTVNFMMDISRDFTDSATADSLLKDAQTPAAITAITGTATTNDALDFNADGFAEGDGAYTYTAAGTGIAHFKFVNTVTHFSPAFRIKSWSFATLPEYVVVDNQTLTRDYQFNAYVNTSAQELIIQIGKTFTPGTHLFYIAHKTGLAVTLNHFEAIGGEGVDTLRWSTESEMENLGFHLWRRIAAIEVLPDSLLPESELTPGAGVANALLRRAKVQAKDRDAAAATAAPAKNSAGGGSTTSGEAGPDTLPEMRLSAEELRALGYVRITAKLIPGAEGGSSAATRAYRFIDRTAAYGTTYDYLLEAVDFHGGKVQYGPRQARPSNPLETALHPNYPNPFNPMTTLRFSLKEKAKVSLVVYDGKGRVVRTLLRPEKPMLPGKYRLLWDARDDRGMEVPSGQYFYRFSVPRYTKTRKMVLVK